MCKYMQPFIGDSFIASISGMNNAGFFVTLENTGAEGLVSMMSLTGDAYTFDAQKQLITNGQQTHRIGDHLTVLLKSVDLRARKMSFEVA